MPVHSAGTVLTCHLKMRVSEFGRNRDTYGSFATFTDGGDFVTIFHMDGVVYKITLNGKEVKA